MPFSTIKSLIRDRFLEVNNLLNYIKLIEATVVAPAPHPSEHKIIKGLFYVHLYACVEFSVSKLTVDTLSLIKSRGIQYGHFEQKFSTITLSSHLKSVRDCNSKSFLEKSADMFLKTESVELAQFDETFIINYIQNIWGKTFNQLTKTLGMSNFLIEPRHMSIFDEVVENRNKVAHGRDTAENVGSSPQYSDLKTKYDVIYEVINQYVDHFENFFQSKEYIKLSVRSTY